MKRSRTLRAAAIKAAVLALTLGAAAIASAHPAIHSPALIAADNLQDLNCANVSSSWNQGRIQELPSWMYQAGPAGP